MTATRALPLPLTLVLLAVTIGIALAASVVAEDVWEHLSAFSLATCGGAVLLWAARAATGRKPAAEGVTAVLSRAVFWLIRVIPFAGALVAWALGLPAEDALIALVPVVFFADEVLVAAGFEQGVAPSG